MRYVLRIAVLAVVFAGCEREPLGYDYTDEYNLSMLQGGDGGVYFLPPLLLSEYSGTFSAAQEPVVVVCAGAPAEPCATPVAVLDMTQDGDEDTSEVIAVDVSAEKYTVNWKATGEASGQYRIFVTEGGTSLAYIDVALSTSRTSSGSNTRGVRVYGAEAPRSFSGTLHIAFRMEERQAAEPAGGLLAQYYDWRSTTPDFTAATKLAERVDATVDFSDPVGGADVYALGQSDSVMAVWTGFVETDVEGSYYFCLTGDDGLRLWVDGVMFASGWWKKDAPTTHCASKWAEAGARYSVRVEWYQDSGSTATQLQWVTPDNAERRIIPASALSPN